MNVLAVIPARENSKRIPNKTLRLVNNHPLIYYVIKNALESKYISRIIVTTNSKEIEILCNQLGVECLIRNPALCTDDTTLDAVVYDVVRRCECDYVVTLHTDEILIALSTTAAQDEKAKLAIEQLSKLKNCQAHSTVLLSSVDEQLLKKIGVQLTCSPKYEEEDRKYHRR